MAEFNKIIPEILKSEGGYTLNANDAGNYQCRVGVAKWDNDKKKYVCDNGKNAHLTGTNFGISAPTLAGWLGRPATDKEMKNLTQQQATEIYKKMFWDKIKGDEIQDQKKADILVDAYINQTGWVKSMLSDTLNISKDHIKIPLSDDIIDKINKKSNFVNSFLKQRKEKYQKRSEKPGQSQFLRGWLNRLKKFEKQKPPIVNAITVILILGFMSTVIYLTTQKK